MPDLKELIEQRSKKQFKKKSYRPWDLTGSESFSEKSENIPHLIVLPSAINTPIESNDPVSTPVIAKQTPIEKQQKVTDLDIKLDNAIDNKQVSIGEQIDNKKITIRNQSDNNQISIRQQQGTRLDIKKITTPQDLGQYLAPNSTKNMLLQTTGIQKRIMDTVVDVCTANNKLETGPLSTSALATYVSTTIGTVKMSIKRLVDKGFIKRGVGRTARGGYIFLHIDQDILNLVLEIREEKKLFSNPIYTLQTRNQNSGFALDNKLDNNSLYSSSNITNTTKNGKNFEIPEAWISIDFSPLEDIGFTQTQLKQLIEKNSPEIVQESIHFFAADLQKNPDKYKQPLNVIMGVLRKGNAWSKPVGYEAPKDKALREYAERKKVDVEKRNQLVSDLMDAEFSDWQSRLTEQEIENIVPTEVRNSSLKAAKISVLRNHFKDHVLIPRLKGEGVY